jgi:hypothetical protein
MTTLFRKDAMHHYLFEEPDYSQVEAFMNKPHPYRVPVLLYLKGSNGSGKSTVPSLMRQYDPQAYYAVVNNRKLLSVFPSFNTVACGKYDDSNSKGCDALKDTEEMIEALKLAAEHFPGFDLIFEGIIPATIEGPWVPRLLEHGGPVRQLALGYITTPFEVCIERIKGRNAPGKEFKEELVRGKYDGMIKSMERHHEVFPNVLMYKVNTDKSRDEMLQDFIERRYEVGHQPLKPVPAS